MKDAEQRIAALEQQARRTRWFLISMIGYLLTDAVQAALRLGQHWGWW